MSRSILIFFLAILFTLAWHDVSHAQPDGGATKQLWIDVNPAYFITPDFKLYGDVGFRREFDDYGWWRLVVRPAFEIHLGSIFYLTTGLGNFITFNEVGADRWEFRPFQGLKFKWPNWKIPLRHYFRLEERYDFNTETWEAKNSLRFRYKLSFSYRWTARLQEDRFWQATLGAETFFKMAGEAGQFEEQTRITLGLDRSLRRDLHMRFEITWQVESLLFVSDQSVSNIYFRYRLFKSWGDQK